MYTHTIFTSRDGETRDSACVAEVSPEGTILRSNALQVFDGTAGTPAYHARFMAMRPGVLVEIVEGTAGYRQFLGASDEDRKVVAA